MTQTDYITRVLRAEPGCALTQAADVADIDRTITDTVYLAVNDSPERWREVPAQEAAELRAARDAAEASALEL